LAQTEGTESSVPAVKRDLYIEQGATYFLEFTWNQLNPDGSVGDPISLVGCIARMQIRRKQKDPILLSATSDNGKIILGGTAGTVRVELSDDDTDLLTSSSCKYDLEIEFPDGRVVRLLQGLVAVDPNITQELEDPEVG
jgi:hypothetical protein